MLVVIRWQCSRLCLLRFLPREHLDPEAAHTALCALTWFLAPFLEKDLAEAGRLCIVPHKMHIKKDDGDLWFAAGTLQFARTWSAPTRYVTEAMRQCSTVTWVTI